MKKGALLALIIVGFVLIAAGPVIIGYAAWDILSMGAGERESLREIEMMLGEMEAYTGAPEMSPPPGALGPGDIGEMPTVSVVGFETPVAGGSGQGGGSNPSKALGRLVFESLGNREVPVIEGVSAADLRRGAAHHPRTSPPGGVGNCVIFGHRDTVFRGFANLKEGHTIRLEVPGEEKGTKIVYKYKIVSMEVVEPGDPKIYKAYGEKVMTLVTCYPFRYVGSAPKRYIVVTKLEE